MARKQNSIKVEDLKKMVNARLASEAYSQAEKAVLCSLLEGVLLDTHNYKGYNFTKWLNGGCDEWFKKVEAGEFDELNYEARASYMGDTYDRIYY